MKFRLDKYGDANSSVIETERSTIYGPSGSNSPRKKLN
jgi:hypothetical protein